MPEAQLAAETLTAAKQQLALEISQLELKAVPDFKLTIPSLEISLGETVAIVGPNGCGKTSLIETILDLRRYSADRINLLGQSITSLQRGPQAVRIGVQLQRATYNAEYTVADIVGLHSLTYAHYSQDLYHLFDLSELNKKKYGDLSRGQKQRVDLYVALAHEPELIFLDEPGTGLDAVYFQEFIKLLRKLLSNPAVTIIMASHSVEEIDLCQRILCLQDGSIRYDSTRAELISQFFGQDKVVLELNSEENLQDCINELNQASSVLRVTQRERTVTAFGKQLHGLVQEMVKRYGIPAFSFSPVSSADLLQFLAE